MNTPVRTIIISSLIFFSFLPLVSQASYAPQINVLIVPGHDNEVYGANFGKLKEADMNLELSKYLVARLQKDKRFQVITTRDQAGYTKEFATYFKEEKDNIVKFKTDAKKDAKAKKASGEFVETDSIPHNNATESVANILYGINKWANEEKMDAVIHIHFNEYRRSNMRKAGKYQGFAIYMPEKQMKNATESQKLAKNIFTELHKDYGISTFPPEQEKGGFLEDQSLIALGSSGTLEESVRSVLIEYGYIYRFTDTKSRPATLRRMAELTEAGIVKYFFP